MKKLIRYGLTIALLALIVFKSIYVKKLSDIKSQVAGKFDAAVFSQHLWEDKMGAKMDAAMELSSLIQAIGKDPQEAFKKYTNALAIGNYRYALVKMDATVLTVNQDELLLQLNAPDANHLKVKLATEFVYGNAIRDASGLLQVKDFPNTSDLNAISEALNDIVRAKVLPVFKHSLQAGSHVLVTGAIEINQAHLNWASPEIIPVRLQILP